MNKNKIILLSVVIAGAGVALSLVYANRSGNFAPKPTPVNTVSPTPINIWEKTSVYHNEKYGYSLTYPDTILDVESKNPENVGFFDENSLYGYLSISIEPADFDTPQEWFESENKRLAKEGPIEWENRLVLEKQLVLQGKNAITVHSRNKIEEFPYEKTTVFLLNGKLVKIYTKGMDTYDWVMANFKIDQ